jgi:hypothetical protein
MTIEKDPENDAVVKWLIDKLAPVAEQELANVAEPDPCEHHWVAIHEPAHIFYWIKQCQLCGKFNWDFLDEEIASMIKSIAETMERAITGKDDLLEAAWGLIANAGWDAGSGVTDIPKTAGWHEAAVRWREDYFGQLTTEERETPLMNPVYHIARMRELIEEYEPSRERSLAITKLDECEMWLAKCTPAKEALERDQAAPAPVRTPEGTT